MESGGVQIYFGEGHGKTSAAIGYAVQAASWGQNVFIIHFLKGRMSTEAAYMQRLEPEIKVFHFEKGEKRYEDLTEQEKQEENRNLQNGVNFARKVLLTGECDLLVLDELLGVIDHGVISLADVESLFEARTEGTRIILTGRVLPDQLRAYATEIYQISTEKGPEV